MSIFDTVTVEQFKAYFFRDFPFLPVWNITKTYWKDDTVYYNNNFYQSLIDDNTGKAPDTNTESWKKVKDDIYNYITDEDIEKAMSQAICNGNENFGEDCNEKVNIYLHLVAYYLVVDLKNASVGINSGVTNNVTSTHVGDVSESYSIPQWIMNNPMYSMFSQNGYGLKYLSLIAPYLACTVMFSHGTSTLN